MFGEDYSESPKLASPWATPRIQTPSSSLSLSSPQPLSSLASSSSSLHKSSSEENETFSGEITSSGSDDDVEELKDALAATSFSSSGPSGGSGRRSAIEAAAKHNRPRRLSAEVDESGHIEYKLKLTAATPDRFNRLVTQLKWRLLQGGGEAMYEIGVLDDGTLVGLSRTDLLASLRTLEQMADELGATVVVLKEIRLAKHETDGPGGDDGGKRRKWEAWKAFADEKAAGIAAMKEQQIIRTQPASETASSSTPVLGQSSSSTANAPSSSPGPHNFAISPIADLPSSVSGTTDKLYVFSKSHDRANRKKKQSSNALFDASSPDPSSTFPTRPHKVRRHRHMQRDTSHPPSDDDGNGMFSVFDLDLDDPSQPEARKPAPPLKPVSRKKAHEDEKAARRKLKRALKDEESMRSLWGGGEEVEDEGEEEGGGWAGQSLDIWGEDAADVGGPSAVAAGVGLDLDILAPLSPPPSSSFSSAVDVPHLPPSSPTDTITTATSPPLSTSLTPSPSPLLLPTYRPPSSLLSTTPRAAFPPLHVPTGDATSEEGEEVEDGTERICVEALVVRKEMEGHINFDDLGKWMNGGGTWAA